MRELALKANSTPDYEGNMPQFTQEYTHLYSQLNVSASSKLNGLSFDFSPVLPKEDPKVNVLILRGFGATELPTTFTTPQEAAEAINKIEQKIEHISMTKTQLQTIANKVAAPL